MTSGAPARTRPEPRLRAKTFWTKASRFRRSAAANAAAAEWDPAVSAAVHAAINLVDALCVEYVGIRSSSQAHQDALVLLQQAKLQSVDVRTLGRHVEGLLEMKNLAEYEGRLLEKGDAARAIQHLERAFALVLPLAHAHNWETRSS